MGYFILTMIGFIGGGICVFVALDAKRRRVDELQRRQAVDANRLAEWTSGLASTQKTLDQQSAAFASAQAEFNARAVSYDELRAENAVLKRDLRNMDLQGRKLQLDRNVQAKQQAVLDERANELGARFLKDNIKWIGSNLTPNNFVNSKQRLQDVITWCRDAGFTVSNERETVLLGDLKREYEKVVRAALEREEQARIKAQIREEQAREREIQRAQEQVDRERAAIQAALDRALAEARGQHSAEIERLKAQLADAEQRQRAISQAQITKAGYVYVISNIGSFGEGVFKVGMTRRLEPMDRVHELGDASVPFPFDVHMMISADDAPALENALHRKLHGTRINKTNPRKEFFRTEIGSICAIIKEHHGEVEYVADAEALQYRQSLNMSDDDEKFIESVYDAADDRA